MKWGAIKRSHRHERVGADDVECRHPEQLLRVVHARGLEHLGRDRHGRVDGIGNNVDHGLGRMRRDGDGEGVHDARVDVEEVVAGHARLAGHSCGDDHEVSAGEGGGELVGARVARDLCGRKRERKGRKERRSGLSFLFFFQQRPRRIAFGRRLFFFNGCDFFRGRFGGEGRFNYRYHFVERLRPSSIKRSHREKGSKSSDRERGER